MTELSYKPSAATEVTSDVSGKVCLITGANSGVGRVTALELARAGAHVFLACRSEAKAAPVVEAIKAETGNPNVDFVALDLGSLASVRACAAAFLERDLPLHLLIANAGLQGPGLTEDGFNLSVGVNHVGHFLLTQLLLDRLRESAPARVVIVASKAHRLVKNFDLDKARESGSYVAMQEYAVSKAMNIIFARELGRRLEGSGVTTYSLHPGVVASQIWRRIPQPFRWLVTRKMITNAEGARTSLFCATDPTLAEESGHYYDKCERKAPNPPADDDTLAVELWDRSMSWAGLAAG